MQKDLLVERAQKGNQKAFRQLFELNAGNLYRFLRKFSKNTDQVEDWVQRAFIQAFKNIHSFNCASKFSTWLFRIGINEMKTDLRVKNLELEIIDEENLNGNEQNDFEWDDKMQWLLKELDEFQKSVFILYEVEGYSHIEISGMLDISENSCRTILHRTKKILKEKWLKQRG
jgi:RNA polymerase sigma-70 factor, ECF subfamily